MAKRKEPPKPLSRVRFDFVDALENVCNQSLMMLQAVDMLIRPGNGIAEHIPDPVRQTLAERGAALREALIGGDDG